MKKYDFETNSREYKVGNKILVLLPLMGKPLHCTFSGPYRLKVSV